MADIREKLILESKNLGIKISAEQAAKFQRYMELLIEWNEKLNLTAITEPGEILEKHFLDRVSCI